MKAAEVGMYLLVILGVGAWITWPKKEEKAQYTSREAIEITLLEALPQDFLDTLDAQLQAQQSSESDSVAIWAPHSLPGVPGSRPVWTGTARDLRRLLESRRHRDSALP